MIKSKSKRAHTSLATNDSMNLAKQAVEPFMTSAEARAQETIRALLESLVKIRNRAEAKEITEIEDIALDALGKANVCFSCEKPLTMCVCSCKILRK